MTRLSLALVAIALPWAAVAETPKAMIAAVVDGHILPRFEALATTTQSLSDAAIADCTATSASLRAAYGAAFDAWVAASHLRFGPTEVDDRAFGLAFWPDSRGATPRALAALIADQDPIAASATGYAQVSIAARGFYAMEFLLYVDTLMTAGDAGYHCQLVQTISADIAQTSQDILTDWTANFAATMKTPSATGVYRTDEEALQEMLKALSTGLQFTSDSRLGRPLGTFDQPRPTRAEARRSGRSAQHVMVSLIALQDLALQLSTGHDALSAKLDASFEQALSQLSYLNDPVFAGVAAPQTRLKVEVVQQSIDSIRTIVRDELGPTLGVAAGFNALDGD